MVRRGTAWEAFDRDCCLLLENCFFAQGQGIKFDKEALNVLRQVPPKRPGIDNYAVFGRTANRQVNGLRGTFLAMSGDLADHFVAWLKDQSQTLKNHQRNEEAESESSDAVPAKACRR